MTEHYTQQGASWEPSDADKVRMLLAEAGYSNVDLSEDGLTIGLGLPLQPDHQGLAAAFERAHELVSGEKEKVTIIATDAYGNPVEVPRGLD